MRIIILLAVLLGLQLGASAYTDYTCVQNCVARGEIYQGCLARCTYPTD